MTTSEKMRAVAPPAPELAHLITRCQDGDRVALGEFYSRYRGEVSRNIYRVLGPFRSDLEDVMQEVFIEVFRSIARFRGDAQISTWLYRLCVNVALQRMRKRRRMNEISDDKVSEPTDHETPEQDVDAKRRLAAVYRLLDSLSPKKRLVFILHEIDGLEPREIANIVGAPVLTVRTRLHYARKEFFALAAKDPSLDDRDRRVSRQADYCGREK